MTGMDAVTQCDDPMDPARALALQVALDRAPDLGAAQALPPFYHQIYFWDAQPPEALGRDGHPRVGGVIPDLGLPRRMWAGGQLIWHAPLCAGHPARKTTQVEEVSRKEGRSGPLGFVKLRHEIRQNGQLCITEWQDLVYREEATADAPKPQTKAAPTDETQAREVSFTSTLLFRYSALTFNGHRIHYDETYSRQIEGYDGLVVHGPLLAQLLMLMAAEDAPLRGFRFRAMSPVMHHETATLCRKGDALWVRGQDGRLCMQAEVTDGS